MLGREYDLWCERVGQDPTMTKGWPSQPLHYTAGSGADVHPAPTTAACPMF